MYMTLLLSVSSIALNITMAPYFDGIFFVGKNNFAGMVKKYIIDSPENQSTDLAFIPADEGCYFLQEHDGGFFRVYGGIRRTVYCFNSMQDAEKSLIFNKMAIYKVIDKKIVEIKPIANGIHKNE